MQRLAAKNERMKRRKDRVWDSGAARGELDAGMQIWVPHCVFFFCSFGCGEGRRLGWEILLGIMPRFGDCGKMVGIETTSVLNNAGTCL